IYRIVVVLSRNILWLSLAPRSTIAPMPSKAIGASPAVARFLKETRETLGLTLRGVAAMSAEVGNPIPHSTLARIERGKLDPGVLRLQQLLRLYNLPTQAAGDLLDLEAL